MTVRRAQLEAVQALERDATRVVVAALERVLADVAPTLGAITAAAEGQAEAAISLNDLAQIQAGWIAEVDGTVLPYYRQVFEMGGQGAEAQVARLGITVPESNLALIDDAAVRHLGLARNRLLAVGDLTWTLARDQLLEGFAQGEGIDPLRRRLQGVTKLSTARAEAVARTEVIAAANQGALARVTAMGVDAPPYKQWLSTLDARTRPTHREADGQVVPLGDRFQVGSAHLDVPGDPTGPLDEVVQCRCTLLFIDTLEPLDADGRQDGGIVTVTEPLVAAATPHTGAMLALIPSAADIDRLAIEGGEDPADLHLTLWYLGEASDLDDEAQTRLLEAATQLAATTQPLDLNVFGAAVWNPQGDEPCAVYNVGGAGLAQVRAAAEPPADIAYPEQHTPWAAHVCAGYSPDPMGLLAAMIDRAGPVTFDTLRLALGAETYDLQLSAVPAAAVTQEEAMPWEVRPGGESCPFEVIRSDTGERVACHDSQQAAEDQVRALYANEPDAAALMPEATAAQPGEHWHAIAHIEGLSTGLRTFTNLTHRDPPFAYHWQRSSSAHGGMPEVIQVGNVTRTANVDGVWHYFGVLDLGSPTALEYGRQLVDGFARWVSIGLDEQPKTVEVIWPEDMDEDDPMSMFAEPEQIIYDGGTVAELCAVSVPAQADAQVEPTPELITAINATRSQPMHPVPPPAATATPVPGPRPVEGPDNLADAAQVLVASAHRIEIPDLPPPQWFEEPADADIPGAFCVTDEGRVFGYLAPAGTRHRAYANTRDEVYAPSGNVDYTRFMGAEALVQGGRVAAGPVTMDCGHAPRFRHSADEAPAHYDNAATVVAMIAVGENVHGTWAAGALLPGVSVDQLTRMLACRLSGDWQPHPDKPGMSELIAALLVPSPGFAMARKGPTASYDQDGALVASSMPVRAIHLHPEPTPMARVISRVAASVGRDPKSRIAAAAAKAAR